MDRFETDQKVLTAAPAGAAAPTGPATAPASPGASRTELIRVFYVVLYPYRAESPLAARWHRDGRRAPWVTMEAKAIALQARWGFG